jgi:5-formyltetrahydrofolate cyclo-ligase
MDKKEIRKTILQKRSDMPLAKNLKKSRKIAKFLEALPEFIKARRVLFYYTNGSEADTTELINKYLTKKELYLPEIKDNENFHAIRITEPLKLKKGLFGVPEPVGYPLEDDSVLEVIIVPGVAFDPNGNRLGMGKGYYDRYLKKCARAIKIGLAFSEQLLESVPVDQYDVPMDIVITDERIYIRN